MPEEKVVVTNRLTKTCVQLIERKSRELGVTKSAVIELGMRRAFAPRKRRKAE